jgi:hypothetical protein
VAALQSLLRNRVEFDEVGFDGHGAAGISAVKFFWFDPQPVNARIERRWLIVPLGKSGCGVLSKVVAPTFRRNDGCEKRTEMG